MDFDRTRDEALASNLRQFIAQSYPPEFRERKFSWPYSAEFTKKFIEWERKFLVGEPEAALYTVASELAAAQIDLRASMTGILVGSMLEEIGTEQQKKEIGEQLIHGGAQACLGLTEPDCGSDLAAVTTSARRAEEGWVINGQKIYTTNAELAEYVLLLTRTDTSVPKHRGLTTFIVPMNTPGIEIRPIATLRGHSTNTTYYTDVFVPDSARVGTVNGGWGVIRTALEIEHRATNDVSSESDLLKTSFRLSGILQNHSYHLQNLLDHVVSWAGHALRMDGSRMLDDPSVRQRLARIAIDAEVGRLLAERNDAQRQQPGVGNGAKLFASEAYARRA
jgi:alkylation response protein AidB-like acyl-CoA dehydrogenase